MIVIYPLVILCCSEAVTVATSEDTWPAEFFMAHPILLPSEARRG
jgi:hypothetical protein